MSDQGFLIADVMREADANGLDGIKRLAPGPFLIEIPLQSPRGMNRLDTDDHQIGTSHKTVSFDEELLLELKRSRASKEARVYSLIPGGIVGRAGKSDVALRGDESISAEHVRFTEEGDQWTLVDLGSTNGTFVNRERVSPKASRALEPLVSVQLGARRFAFADAEDLHALLTPVQRVECLLMERLRNELETLGSRRFLLRHTSNYLLISYAKKGSDTPDTRPSEAYPIVGERSLKIGRTSKADITIRNDSVSKWHAKLSPKGEERWVITDTGSSNGTEVNGRELEKGESASLSNWDAINFGNAAWGLYLDPRGLLENLMENM